MSRLLLALSALVASHASNDIYEVERLVFWSNDARTQKLWEYQVGVKEAPLLTTPDVFYADTQIKLHGESVKPAQVSLLFTSVSNTDLIGTHPSFQISLRTSSKASSLFQSKVQMNSKEQANLTGGVYRVELLVADTGSTKPLRLSLGKVRVPPSSSRNITHAPYIPELSDYHELPSIAHPFAPPEPRASPAVSGFFTLLVVCLAPLFFVFYSSKLGMNMKGLASVPSFVFMLGIVSFMVLIGMFFAFLNLVETSAAAIVLTIAMVVVGNRVLCEVRTNGDLDL
jgi:hypothetical protein